MAEHVLQAGVRLIKALRDLGEALDYFSTIEKKVPKSGKRPAANDVAWLRDDSQDYPLFVFEVESQTTNAAARNVTKVYGRTDPKKPLFFFHIFLKGKSSAPRVRELRALFGKNNYRIYALKEEPLTVLVKDIVEQHRRLSLWFPVAKVMTLLQEPPWESVDLRKILVHVEAMNFKESAANLLPAYAVLALDNPFLITDFVRLLDSGIAADYDTYWGQNFADLFHAGIRCAVADSRDGAALLDKLRNLISDSIYFRDYKLHLGQGHEYDQFVLDISPAFLGLLAALARDIPSATLTMSNKCSELIEYVHPRFGDIVLFAASWALHLAAAAKDNQRYEVAREKLNANGGMPPSFVDDPPAHGDALQHGNDFEDRAKEVREPVPPLGEFLQKVPRRTITSKERAIQAAQLAIAVLVDESAHLSWGPRIIRLLYATNNR
jgi:hypothetical protein